MVGGYRRYVQRRDTGEQQGASRTVLSRMISACEGLKKRFINHEVGFSGEIVDAEAPDRLLTGRNAQRGSFSRTRVVGGNGPRSVVRPREDDR